MQNEIGCYFKWAIKKIPDKETVKLLDPHKVTERLFKPPTYLPNTAYDDIRKNLKTNKSAKSFKRETWLFQPGHLINVMSHNISHEVQYHFLKGSFYPQQKPSFTSYVFEFAYTKTLISGVPKHICETVLLKVKIWP